MSDDGRREFSTVDYVVFALSLAMCAGMGVVSAIRDCCKKTSGEEALKGGKMGVFPVSMSVLASFLAAPFVIGTPAEMYCFGTQYALVVIGFGLGTPIVAHVFIPLFHNLNIVSGYEYLEKRFNHNVRLVGSITFGLMMILYMAVVVYAPALAFSQVTDLPLEITVFAVGATCTFYTAVGGLKAVIWIDVIQMLIILAGLFALVIKGLIDVGGFAKVWEAAERGGRIEFDNFSPHPHERHTVWTMTIGGMFTTLVLIGTNQAIVQKYLSVPKLKDAQKTPYLAWVFLTLYMMLVCFAGLVMYAYYEGCDPLVTEKVAKLDQLIPLFVMDVLGPLLGVPGLFTAAVFSATLSTVAAGVNALAAITYMDAVVPLYKRCTKSMMSSKLTTIVTKSLAVFYGLVTIGLAYMAPLLGNALLQISISIFGVAGGPLLGLFMSGMFFPFVNTIGALTGLVVSLLFSFWMAIGAIATNVPATSAVFLPLRTDNCTAANITDVMTTYGMTPATTEYMTTPLMESTSSGGINDFYRVSYMWYTLIAVAITMLISVLVSLITGGRKGQEPLNPNLLMTCRKQSKYEEDCEAKEEISSIQKHDLSGNVNQAYTPYEYKNGSLDVTQL